MTEEGGASDRSASEDNLPDLGIDAVFFGAEGETPRNDSLRTEAAKAPEPENDLLRTDADKAPEPENASLRMEIEQAPEPKKDRLPADTRIAPAVDEDFLRLEVQEAQTPQPGSSGSRNTRRRRALSVPLVICLVIVCIGISVFLWVAYQLNRGKNNMLVNYGDAEITMPSDDNGRTVRYNGKVYRLNPNLATILFMGIDRDEMESYEEYGYGGQADVIMLIVEDVETGKVNILNISRDTYAEFMQYTVSGNEAGYTKKQICLSYAYGDGREKSCENTKKAVQNLLYGMPISRYVAIDMEGVVEANEAIGGVDLESLEDLELSSGKKVKAGERITLHGEDVNKYLRSRKHDIEGNNRRIERGKQYASRFASIAVKKARANITIIPSLYRTVRPYIVSDLEFGDLIYLARLYMNYGVEFAFKNLTGEMGWMKNQYDVDIAVFYPDDENLFETVLELFYTEVDEGA